VEPISRPRFENRRSAGSELAARLLQYHNRPDVLVLALPRGGVPVAFEVARALHAPMDVLLVRKLGVPEHRELAMGAIASSGIRVLNDDVIEWYGISPAIIDEVARHEQAELERRERAYREEREPLPIQGRTVLIVDDGLATGSTMKAAVKAIRCRSAARIVVAVPVGAPETCDELRKEADEVICVLTPAPLSAVGLWYRDFDQTSDEEVSRLLREQWRPS